jgi:hypothetical protein
MRIPIIKAIRGDRVRELEHLAKVAASLSGHLATAEYNRPARMALYDLRASLQRLGFETPEDGAAGKEAAPGLIEALAALVDYVETDLTLKNEWVIPPQLAAARAAIARVTNEQTTLTKENENDPASAQTTKWRVD